MRGAVFFPDIGWIALGCRAVVLLPRHASWHFSTDPVIGGRVCVEGGAVSGCLCAGDVVRQSRIWGFFVW